MTGATHLSGVSAWLAGTALSLGAAAPSVCADALPPFKPYVDMKTFMGHVVSPAAAHIWSVNAIVIDAQGEHDLSPQSDADWEALVSAAAVLAEATNALLIPQRRLDRDWNGYVSKLGEAADTAWRAAEAHDSKALSKVSDELDGICSSCHRHYKLE